MSEEGKKKILIVDDEEKFTKMVKKNLENKGGFEVRTESRGSQALAAAQEFQPDLVFLDVMMPDMRGTDVAVQIKNDPKLKNTPIVFVTATLKKGQTEGFGGLVQGRPFTIKPAVAKPVNTDDLLKLIHEHLDKPAAEGEGEEGTESE